MPKKPQVAESPRVQKGTAKYSARPVWNTDNIKDQGPVVGVRRLQESRQERAPFTDCKSRLLAPGVLPQPPHQKSGYNRFDEERPTTYISEHLVKNWDNDIQVTGVSSPGASWEHRLPQRPWNGSDPAKHKDAGEQNPEYILNQYLPEFEKSPRLQTEDELRNWMATRSTGPMPNWNHMWENTNKVTEPWKHGSLMGENTSGHHMHYSPTGGHCITRNTAEPTITYRQRCSSMPDLHERIKYKYHNAGIWGHLQPKDKHSNWEWDRRKKWQQFARGDGIWIDGVDRRNAMLGHNEVKEFKKKKMNDGTPSPMSNSPWAHRLPWLHDSPTKHKFDTSSYKYYKSDLVTLL